MGELGPAALRWHELERAWRHRRRHGLSRHAGLEREPATLGRCDDGLLYCWSGSSGCIGQRHANYGVDLVRSKPRHRRVQFAGTTVLAHPDANADTTSLAVGNGALTSQSATGSQNTAVGNLAGQYISTGTSNTALGYLAMQGVSATPLTSCCKTAVGENALNAIQGAAISDTAVGNGALSANTTGKLQHGGRRARPCFQHDRRRQRRDGLAKLAIRHDRHSQYCAGYAAMLGVSATPLTGNYHTGVGNFALSALQGATNDKTGVGNQALKAD